jgi:hypothetical protein
VNNISYRLISSYWKRSMLRGLQVTRKRCSIVKGLFGSIRSFIFTHTFSSLLHRMPPIYAGEKHVINDIQPALHPLEVLFDVEKLIRFQAVSGYGSLRWLRFHFSTGATSQCGVREMDSSNWTL